MAGLGNRRGSKTSSGSRTARDRMSAAREKMGGGSRSSKPSSNRNIASKNIAGAKRRPQIGGGSKGDYILTESADNLIGGKFTKKAGAPGARRATREELLEKRKKAKEKQDKLNPKRGVRNLTPEEKKALREKKLEQAKNRTDQRARPGKKTDVVRGRLFQKPGSKSGGVQAFKPSDKASGPVRGPARGNVGPGRKGVGPKRPVPPEDRARIGGNQINNPALKAGFGQGGKRRSSQGLKQAANGDKRGGPPRQAGGNVGPGGKGPNRAGVGSKAGFNQGGKRRSSPGLKQAANSDYDFIV